MSRQPHPTGRSLLQALRDQQSEQMAALIRLVPVIAPHTALRTTYDAEARMLRYELVDLEP